MPASKLGSDVEIVVLNLQMWFLNSNRGLYIKTVALEMYIIVVRLDIKNVVRKLQPWFGNQSMVRDLHL